MRLDLNNDIDSKIFTTYNSDILKMIDTKKVDYLGINISSDEKSDYDFKIYYQHAYSKSLYESSKNKNSLIDFLISNNMMRFLTIVNDNNNDFFRYDAGVGDRTNENMEKLFNYMSDNIEIFNVNKSEIFKISKMKSIDKENFDYYSLYFIAYIQNKNNSVLKCHWCNSIRGNREVFNSRYYLNFLEQLGIDEFKILSQLIKKVLCNCDGKLWMEGIDYNLNGAQKHKIYVCYPKKLYEGLLKSLSNEVLKNKIENMSMWHKNHPELFCEGFALGLDKNKNYTLNFYYKNKQVYKKYKNKRF